MKTRKRKKNRDALADPDCIGEKYGDGRYHEDSRRMTPAEREMLRYQGGEEPSAWQNN